MCAGRIHRNSCQPKESVTLQTFAALYTGTKVDSGHTLSMRGRAWAPGDTDIINTDMSQ